MSEKRVPGADWVYMVYDSRDRVVLTQDGNQRSGSTKYWTFTKYDLLNRPIMTGIKDTSVTVSQFDMQGKVNTFYATKAWAKFGETYVGNVAGNLHGYSNKSYPVVTSANGVNADDYVTVSYYDNYDFRTLWTGTYTYLNESLSEPINGVTFNQPATEFSRTSGLQTGNKTKVLDGGIRGGSTWLKSITFYDDKARVIQTLTDNYKGGLDRTTMVLDFSGKTLESKVTHKIGATTRTVSRRFEYDAAARPIRIWHSLDGATEILLVHNTYNELGQLIDKRLHSTVANGSNAKQSVDYRYNIRGWITTINNSELANNATNDDTGDLFGMELAYQKDLGTGYAATLRQYNGNISAIKWSSQLGLATIKQMAYNFSYDSMNRLSAATHKQATTLNSWASGQYDENLTYDLNGNIKTLVRKGDNAVVIDDLKYDYGTGGNRLNYVKDDATDATKKFLGFLDRNTGTAQDYTYDANGNMTRDLNKGIGGTITSTKNIIKYNYLNLPETVTKKSASVRYIYTATGVKLAQIVDFSTTQKRTDYCGEFIYENDLLQFINHEEGRIMIANTTLIVSNNGESISNLTANNSTLTLQTIGAEKYVMVKSNGTVARTGIFPAGGTVTVSAGQMYKIRAKGYRTGMNPVYIQVKANSTDLNWPGATLPASDSTESWVEQVVTIPAGATTLQAGVTWNTTVTTNEVFYLNEFEITLLGTTTPEYQYHLKDHLGNVRVTFTSKVDIESFTATLETVNANAEQAKFLRYDNAKRVNAAIFDRTNGASTGYSQRLSGRDNEKYGLARSISVMPGDVINMEVYAKYVDTNTANWTAALNTLMSQIAANTAGVVFDGAAYATSTSSFPFAGLLSTAGSTGGPKAYLTWLFFDRNWGFVPALSGYKRMSTIAREYGQDVAHEQLTGAVTATQAGYMYIYLSNEEPNTTPIDVYFDDFKVTQTKSPIIQANDYYPFGLTFNSYQRENSLMNDWRFQGQENVDDLGLSWDSFKWRNYQAEIGRFFGVDPLSEKYVHNSPYAFSENKVITFRELEGLEAVQSISGQGAKEQLKEEIHNAGEAIKNIPDKVKETVKDAGTAVVDKVKEAGNNIKEAWNAIGEYVKNGGGFAVESTTGTPSNSSDKNNRKSNDVDPKALDASPFLVPQMQNPYFGLVVGVEQETKAIQKNVAYDDVQIEGPILYYKRGEGPPSVGEHGQHTQQISDTSSVLVKKW